MKKYVKEMLSGANVVAYSELFIACRANKSPNLYTTRYKKLVQIPYGLNSERKDHNYISPFSVHSRWNLAA